VDYHRLGLGASSSLIQALHISDWGASVLLDCIYEPSGEQYPYQLSFQGCSQLRIDMMPDKGGEEQEADLLGISLGLDDNRSPAILTTDLFELHVTYGQFQCIKPRPSARLPALAEALATSSRHRV